MPVATVQRGVEVADQPLGCEVEFHLAEQFGQHEHPKLPARQRLTGGEVLRELRALFPPPGGEEVILVDAVLVGLP